LIVWRGKREKHHKHIREKKNQKVYSEKPKEERGRRDGKQKKDAAKKKHTSHT